MGTALLAAFSMAVLPAGAASAEQSTAGDFDWETDFQWMYQQELGGGSKIARADDGYYIRASDILYYADEELETVFPLCYRPDCLHGASKTIQERLECSAYLGIGSVVSSLQYYDGMLKPPVLHRSYYYYMYLEHEVLGYGSVRDTLYLGRKNIETGEEEILYSTDEVMGTSAGSLGLGAAAVILFPGRAG